MTALSHLVFLRLAVQKAQQWWHLYGDVGQKMLCHPQAHLLKSSDVYFSS